jgi:hypothetical protein
MKTVRNVVRKIRVIAARFQGRRVGLLTFGLVSGVLLVACVGVARPPDQSANAPAVDQGKAANQDEPVATKESNEEPADTKESEEEPAATEESEDEPANIEEGEEEPVATEESQENLPGSEEFGMTPEELVKNIEAVEVRIATCMSDAGFEYVPVDYATVRQAMTSDKSAPGLSSEEYAATYGYGISTQPPGGADSPAIIGLGKENVQTINSLSKADQDAYFHTLFGENPEATFAVTLEAEDFSETGGCTRTAIEQVFSSEELSASYYNPGDARIEQDPRVIAAIASWSDCMRQAGFDYNTPEETEEDLQDRLDAILKGADPETLSAPAQDALKELQGEERAIAVADLECAVKFVEPVVQQVEAELYGAPQ